jgi:hypothetical protein
MLPRGIDHLLLMHSALSTRHLSHPEPITKTRQHFLHVSRCYRRRCLTRRTDKCSLGLVDKHAETSMAGSARGDRDAEDISTYLPLLLLSLLILSS